LQWARGLKFKSRLHWATAYVHSKKM